MQDQKLAVAILAAGRGTRMQSDQAKVLHSLGGRPLLAHVLDITFELAPTRVLVVVGYQADSVRATFPDSHIEYILQSEQLGTGHAVVQCEKELAEFSGDLLILCGDMPLLKVATVKRLLQSHRESGAACTFLSLKGGGSKDFGRVVRDESGAVQKIVEYRDATDQEKTVDEYNSGVYCFQKGLLFKALSRLGRDNTQGEYYLTDTVRILIRDGEQVKALATTDESEIFGINSAEDLKRAETLLAS